MRIKTERGWMPLQVTCTPMPEAPPIYRGPIPSKACEAYVALLDAAHAEWVERRAAMIADNEIEVAEAA